MPRPVTTLAPDTFDAATRDVHFAASVAALRTPSHRGCGDVALAELVRIQLGQMRELVDHPFLREEIRRIERRAKGAELQDTPARARGARASDDWECRTCRSATHGSDRGPCRRWHPARPARGRPAPRLLARRHAPHLGRDPQQRCPAQALRGQPVADPAREVCEAVPTPLPSCPHA